MPPGPEIWGEARRLVLEEGLSYAEVAERTGLPLSTIQKRASAEQWQAAREDHLGYLEKARRVKRRILDAVDARFDGDGGGDATEINNLMRTWLEAERTIPEHRYGDAKGVDGRQKLAIAKDVLDEVRLHLEAEDRPMLTKWSQHLPAIGRRVAARFGVELG